MNSRFKEIWEDFVVRNGEQGFFAEAIKEALTLATESEQLRKERDDYKDAYNRLLSETLLAKKVTENGNA